MNRRQFLHSALLVGASVPMLVACGTTPGMFNGLGDDLMSMIIIYRSDKLPLTYEQYLAVQGVAEDMGIYLKWQLSSPFEATASGGVAFGAAGAAGGATQGLFYPGALTAAAAGYTGAVYGLGGVVTGATTYSYGKDYDVADMTEKTMRDREDDGEDVFHHIHVVAAFVRSRNNKNSPAPDLAAQMPDFHGVPAGSTTR